MQVDGNSYARLYFQYQDYYLCCNCVDVLSQTAYSHRGVSGFRINNRQPERCLMINSTGPRQRRERLAISPRNDCQFIWTAFQSSVLSFRQCITAQSTQRCARGSILGFGFLLTSQRQTIGTFQQPDVHVFVACQTETTTYFASPFPDVEQSE